jgi:hypothetical protein
MRSSARDVLADGQKSRGTQATGSKTSSNRSNTTTRMSARRQRRKRLTQPGRRPRSPHRRSRLCVSLVLVLTPMFATPQSRDYHELWIVSHWPTAALGLAHGPAGPHSALSTGRRWSAGLVIDFRRGVTGPRQCPLEPPAASSSGPDTGRLSRGARRPHQLLRMYAVPTSSFATMVGKRPAGACW